MTQPPFGRTLEPLTVSSAVKPQRTRSCRLSLVNCLGKAKRTKRGSFRAVSGRFRVYPVDACLYEESSMVLSGRF